MLKLNITQYYKYYLWYNLKQLVVVCNYYLCSSPLLSAFYKDSYFIDSSQFSSTQSGLTLLALVS